MKTVESVHEKRENPFSIQLSSLFSSFRCFQALLKNRHFYVPFNFARDLVTSFDTKLIRYSIMSS